MHPARRFPAGRRQGRPRQAGPTWGPVGTGDATHGVGLRTEDCRAGAAAPSTAEGDDKRILDSVGFEWIEIVLEKLQGIEPYEVTQVLTADRRWPRPAVGLGGVQVLIVWGRTRKGRALKVALRHKDAWDWWIAGVGDLNPRELAELEQWEARDE
jgi:hypothetical protein